MRLRLMHAMLVLASLVLSAPARAEPCSVTNGVDYRFERLFAERTVDDDRDRGTIRLAVYVYRPLRAPVDAIALFSHGSTGGFQFDPAEPQPIVQCSLKNYFLSRGYTLIAFARRGRGESTGTYVEECSPIADAGCTPAANRLLSERALREATADGEAVLELIARRQLAGPRTRTILIGHSRGAVLSFALAAAHPGQIAGVLNFAGGWLGVRPGSMATSEDALRVDYQRQLFAGLGARYRGPSLWIYAARDPLYDRSVTDGFLSAFTGAGGNATPFFVGNHRLENGHLLIQESQLWAAAADAFLAQALPRP